jgi:ABC-type phosphate/phosphonate transport system substrate-binding protein
VKRKKIILILVVFVIIELMAILFSVWFSLFNQPVSSPPEIRIGIYPEVSKKACEEKWSIFFDRFKDSKRFKLTPYYANSYEEAIKGFVYGSLDLLYINAAVFVRLKREQQAKALVYHIIPEEEKDYFRSALVAQTQFEFFNQTEDCRLAFTNRNSMTGGIVPLRYLEGRLNKPLNKWFSKIDYSMTEVQGLDMLTNKKTDLLAINLLFLREYLEKEGKANRNYKIIWVSGQLPEPVICVNKKSKYYDSPLLKEFQNMLFDLYRERVRFNRLSLLFEPVNYDYNNRLIKLEKFLYEDKNKKSSKSILMGNKK